MRSGLQVVPGSSVLNLDRSAGWPAVPHPARMLLNVGSERPAVSDWASALSWGRDEADLVHELRAGSETAFDWLVTHYHAPVYNPFLGTLGETSASPAPPQQLFPHPSRAAPPSRHATSLKP